MTHKILKCLGIYPNSHLVTAVDVASNMMSDVRHLNPEDIVIPFHRMLETILPVHCFLRHTILISELKAKVSAGLLVCFPRRVR